MAVITPDGAVGKVIEVYRDTAQVLLLTDKEGGAGAMLVDSRTQGVVGGTGDPMMQMKFVANEDNVAVGEQIVTSGMDKIFPRDIPIGKVEEVKPGNTFKQIRVQPAAKLDRLETVIVLLTQAPVDFNTELRNPQAPGARAEATAAAEKP
jgi:rod shape-determining protein MreC